MNYSPCIQSQALDDAGNNQLLGLLNYKGLTEHTRFTVFYFFCGLLVRNLNRSVWHAFVAGSIQHTLLLGHISRFGIVYPVFSYLFASEG